MGTFTTAADIEQTVNKHIIDLLALENRAELFVPTTPLMNLGLTSIDLMTLREQLVESFGANLHATFFFQYSSAAAITNYFNAILNFL